MKNVLIARAGVQTLTDSFLFLFTAKRVAKKLIEQNGFQSVAIITRKKTIRGQRSSRGKILWL